MMRNAPRGLALPSLEKRWSIGIYAGTDLLTLEPIHDHIYPVLTARQVTDAPARFVADPFMLRHDSTWYMFFEVFRADSHQGDIGLATSPDGFAWTYRQIVLRESFHLSFPYVFAWNSEFYMIPETSGRNEVRLYRASEFPASWIFERTLLSGAGFTDASIVRHGEKWWMFTNAPGDGTCSLFHADALDAEWVPHPQNPILRGARDRARSAGRIVSSGGRLVRLAQDNTESYGLRVNAFEITTLTPTEYAERPAGPTPFLRGSGRGWNAGGMHHADAHELSPGQWIACVDGFRKAWMLGHRRWPALTSA
jgi:hypothetical protein